MTENSDIAVGARIVSVMTEKKLNQLQLSDKIDLDNTALSRSLKGDRKISSSELAKIAEVLGVTSDYLLGINNTPKWATENDIIDLQKFLDNNEDSMTYGGEKLTNEEKEQLRVAITTIFWKRHRR